MLTIAFLGAGNIAQAIMGGLTQSEDLSIRAYDPVEACRDAAGALGVTVTQNNIDAVDGADIILLCVKPNVVLDVADEIHSAVSSQLVISVAAGITTTSLLEHLPRNTHVVRCMPNTPALVQTGMTALYAGPSVTQDEKTSAADVLDAVGETLWVESESALDAVTAVSGSGPAYFFLVMESMVDAAVQEGLSPSIARQLVLQTALGAARMASQSEDDPGILREKVTSPGGTTQAAIESMLASGLPAAVQEAIHAARVRSEELSGTIQSQ